MRCLLPPPSLNSHRYIPCQVPRFSLPFVIGIVSETPTILDLAWADISVGPSSWCRYLGSPSGTNLSKIPFRSYRTSGSKFSLSDNPQLVCLTKRFSIPVFGNAGKWWSTSLVTRWNREEKVAMKIQLVVSYFFVYILIIPFSAIHQRTYRTIRRFHLFL